VRNAALLLVILGFSLVDGTAVGGEYEYVGSRKCKTCHKKAPIGNQYRAWKESGHARAWDTLAGKQVKKWAAEAGVDDPQSDEKCLECHVTANGVPPELLSEEFDPKAGVQCEACHGAAEGYADKKIMIDRETAEARGLVPQNEEVCTACHNDESPTWDPQRYTRTDGNQVGFDYAQAVEKIAHPVPEEYDHSASVFDD
jgi:hypothetical protein